MYMNAYVSSRVPVFQVPMVKVHFGSCHLQLYLCLIASHGQRALDNRPAPPALRLVPGLRLALSSAGHVSRVDTLPLFLSARL